MEFLQGDVKDVLLLDVTPLSLGIETLNGVFTKLIEKNTTVPTKKSQTFSTAADNQNAVTINVLQGEREFAADNKTLGRFDLVGIPAAPRGVPQIEVTFDIDANGLVHVSAKDKGTGKEQNINITADGGLTDEEIEKMVQEAEMHKEGDEERKKVIDARNELDTLYYSCERTLKENGDKVSDDAKGPVETALKEAKEVLDKGEDVDAMKAATEKLQTASGKMAEELYKTSADQAGPDGPDPEAQGSNGTGTETPEEDGSSADGKTKSGDDDDVIDADFKEV